MTDGDPPATLQVRVVEAWAWAQWIRAVRAEIAEHKEEGHIAPDLAAPEAVHETLLELLAAIDALPSDAEHAELVLPEPERLRQFVEHLSGLGTLFERWLAWGLLSVVRSDEAERFHRELLRRGHAAAPH